MRVSATREHLLEALQSVIGVVERRQTMPILSNVLLSARDNRLRITGTDLEVELVAAAEVGVQQCTHIAEYLLFTFYVDWERSQVFRCRPAFVNGEVLHCRVDDCLSWTDTCTDRASVAQVALHNSSLISEADHSEGAGRYA